MDTLQAKLNGQCISYTPSPLKRLCERLSLDDNRNFYTKKDREILRIRVHPVYLDGDTFRYRANVLRDERNISTRLEEPKKEILEILTPHFDGKISIEKNIEKGRIIIKKYSSDKSFQLRRTYGLDTDLDTIEKFVRGLY